MAVLTSSSSHLFSLLLRRPLSLSPTRLHAPPFLSHSLSTKPSLSLSSLRHTHSLSPSHLSPHLDTDTESFGAETGFENEVGTEYESTGAKLPKRDLEIGDKEEGGSVDVNLPKRVIDGNSEDEAEEKGFEGVNVKLPKRAIDNNSEDEAEKGFDGVNVKLPERAIDGNSEDEGEKGFEREVKGEGGKLPKRDSGWVKLPSLSVKEKKEIGSYAHSLGKKLKSQQVGKGGVTEAVGVALVESLEKNELLKIKIHNNCPGEIDDNVKRLEELTGSVVVGQIGRTVILYRPSMTKLKAEERKKHAIEVVSRRRQAFKSSSENRELVPKEYGRGRRGSSRYSSSS